MPERLLDLLDAFFERHDDTLVLFDLVVDVALQRPDDGGEPVVQLGGVGDTTADDQWRAGFVDENGVDLIDDRVVVAALHLVGQGGGHVVAQVVEAELVVGAIGDVAGVVGPLLRRVLFEAGDDQADVEAHPLVDAAHPLGVEPGEVVVDRDEVHALAAETVEVGGQRADQGLAFTGLHLGHPTEVQCCTTHQLHVEVTLADDPAGRFAHHRERLDQEVVEGLTALDATAELRRLGAKRVVAERTHCRGLRIDVGNQALQGLQLLAFTSSEDAIEDAHAGSKPTGGYGAGIGTAPSAGHEIAVRHHGVPQLGAGRSDELDPSDARPPQRLGGGAQRSAGRDHIVDDQHRQIAPRAPGSKRRAGQTIGTGLAGLRAAMGAVQQSPAGHAQLTGDALGNGLRLVEAPTADPLCTGRRPGDEIDVLQRSRRTICAAITAAAERRRRNFKATISSRATPSNANAARMPSGQRCGPTDASENRHRWHNTSPGHPQAAQRLGSSPEINPEFNMVQSVPGGCDIPIGRVATCCIASSSIVPQSGWPAAWPGWRASGWASACS